MHEMAVVIQGLIRLRHDIVILFVRSQINHLIGYDRILRIRLVHNTVRRLHKAVFVHPRIGCQKVDQTDVRTFRSLNRAHTSVMGVVNIADLESRTVSGQTAGAQCGQTSLVGQLR